MKPIDLANLQPDPVAAAFVKSEKDLILVTGFVCDVNDRAVSIVPSRGSTIFTEYPRDAIAYAFSQENSGEVTLLVDADARVHTVSIARARDFRETVTPGTIGSAGRGSFSDGVTFYAVQKGDSRRVGDFYAGTYSGPEGTPINLTGG